MRQKHFYYMPNLFSHGQQSQYIPVYEFKKPFKISADSVVVVGFILNYCKYCQCVSFLSIFMHVRTMYIVCLYTIYNYAKFPWRKLISFRQIQFTCAKVFMFVWSILLSLDDRNAYVQCTLCCLWIASKV